jgi:DNA adenine methylase
MIIKIPGGKRQLLPKLLSRIPSRIDRYFEPFVGGGALFFELVRLGRLKKSSAILVDANADISTTYVMVRDDVETVIRLLQGEFNNTRECFETVRRQNPDAITRAERAARFLFLNKTCFNGLSRYNSKGGFNAPFGKYENPNFCDVGKLRTASEIFSTIPYAILTGDFAHVFTQDFVEVRWNKPLGFGDVVYFDPPYMAASKTANFTSYTSGGFGPKDQERLRDLALELKSRGVFVLLSNADVEPVRELYGHGFDIERIEARRAINSNGEKRGNVGEVLIW